MKINSLTVENFCGHRKKNTYEFGHKTIVKGANAVGKSTLKKAIQYVLNCRDENGKEIIGIRPHDENGVDAQGLETMAELGMTVDGRDITMKKVFRENINKKGDFTGNVTDYSISDIPKRLKDYEEYLGEIIPNSICLNAQEFLQKDTTNRRKLFEETFSQHTVDDIIDENPEFEPLRDMLKDGTVEELKTRCRVKLKGSKGKGGSRGLEDLLAEIPARIDEVEKQKIDIDVAELELQRNALNEQIAANKTKQDDVSKQYEDYQKLSDGILELKLELNGLHQKANLDLEKKRTEIRGEISAVDNQLADVARQINLNKRSIMSVENAIKENENARAKQEELWHAANARKFDEDSLKCPYCGQEYPAEKKEQMRAEFEAHRTEELKRIADKGMELKASIEKGKAELERLNATLKENEENERILTENANGMQAVYDKLPTSIDISETDEYKAIQSQISEKEAAMQKENSADEIRKSLRAELEDLQSQLTEVEKQISKSQINVQIDERIEELRKEQREIAQKIADVEKEYDLLKRFDRRKAEILENDVNAYFDYVQVRMSEPQVNGDLKEVCSLVVGGESYDRNLNHGDKILAEMDICRAFQKKYGVCLPIILDDCESVDSWRVPDVENQVVLIMRSDDKELIVTNESEVK